MQLSESTRNKLMVVEPIILLIAIFTIGYFVYVVGYTDGPQCLTSPLVYGAGELSNEENGYFSCSCSASNNLNEIISVTPEGIKIQNKEDLIFQYG